MRNLIYSLDCNVDYRYSYSLGYSLGYSLAYSLGYYCLDHSIDYNLANGFSCSPDFCFDYWSVINFVRNLRNPVMKILFRLPSSITYFCSFTNICIIFKLLYCVVKYSSLKTLIHTHTHTELQNIIHKHFWCLELLDVLLKSATIWINLFVCPSVRQFGFFYNKIGIHSHLLNFFSSHVYTYIYTYECLCVFVNEVQHGNSNLQLQQYLYDSHVHVRMFVKCHVIAAELNNKDFSVECLYNLNFFEDFFLLFL